MNQSSLWQSGLAGHTLAGKAKARSTAFGWPLLVLFSLMVFIQVGSAQTPLSEYQVKALFLFNFAKYVEWPTEAFSRPDAPMIIGIVGASPCEQYLRNAVQAKQVSGRPVEVKQVEKPEDLVQCQILFISDSEAGRQAELPGQVKDRPILTVGEGEKFTQQGGVIGFLKRDGKVRLAIDLKAARAANLQISSKLLGVADIVTGKQ